MRHLKEHWFPYVLGLIILAVTLHGISSYEGQANNTDTSYREISIIPNIYSLSNTPADNQIRYGKTLIDSTADYFGPHGKIAHISNGLNCQNCHRESGTRLYSNNFFKVASTYPKFRERSGRLESVEWRINECMQRSLNGEALDSMSKEMRAMVAYIKWTGKNVQKNIKAEGAENKELPFLKMAANPGRGAVVYQTKCITCHGKNGEGTVQVDSAGYVYPPLWGPHSYAASAGMYRLTKLAAFVKYNMPQGADYKNPQLSDEEAWDVAAYINSQPHPVKMFAADWPVIRSKPVDYPFGPYADNFSAAQHKYGPFDEIKKMRDVGMKK